jgi:hypothetical protein
MWTLRVLPCDIVRLRVVADFVPPIVNGTWMRVPPSGMAHTDGPTVSSHPATINPACRLFCKQRIPAPRGRLRRWFRRRGRF